MKFKNIWLHLRKIQKHRKYVRRYCFWAGIPWRGITHDLSKYSPTEFWESAKYYVGTGSPIEEAKKQQGYSRAWLHHRGRNPHHWAYWADNFSEGFTVYPMSKNDFVEMVCDFLAAGKAYSDDNFSYVKEYKWWKREREQGCKAMNEKNKIMLDIILSDLAHAELHDYNFPTPTPKELIKSRYIQDVWEANK
jgi:hypothetical protein